MANPHPVVDILKNEIAMKNYTWEEAASGSGISPSRFEKLMRGEREMKLDEGDRLCKFPGIPVYIAERRAEIERERQSRVFGESITLSRIVPGCVPDSKLWSTHSPNFFPYDKTELQAGDFLLWSGRGEYSVVGLQSGSNTRHAK